MLSATSPDFRPASRNFTLLAEIFVFALLIITVACSTGMGPTSGARVTPANINISVEPSATTLAPNAQQQFTATVQGTSNTAVIWAASAGTISPNGLYTAPAASSTAAIAVITVTSVADRERHASTVAALHALPLTILTSSLDQAVTNAPYSATLFASGGTPPYRWTIDRGSIASGFQLGVTTGALTGSTSQIGTFSFTVKVTDARSNSATESLSMNVSSSTNSGFDGPAELPRVYLQSALADTPAPGTVIHVPAGGNLRDALNAASCGDTIQLQAGATYTGLTIFPAKACDDQHWIIVRTSAPDSSLPAEGTRMTPCYAGVASLPGRPALNCHSTQKVLATVMYTGTGDGPIQFANGANHYRLLGLEVARAANTIPVGALISAVLGATADKIVLDRLWVHGVAVTDTRRGLMLNGTTNVAAVDSYFSDFHCYLSCTDSQAISGGNDSNPMGPYKIADNFLEAAGENVIFGGGASTQTPTDIEVRRNHFFKPMIWMQGQPGFIGVPFIVKNHFELKNAKRVLLDSNIMENTWGGFSQHGFSIVITPKNQSANGHNVCPICQVTDVTIRYATISNVASVLEIGNVPSATGGLPLDGQRYSIHDIIADSILGAPLLGGGTFALLESIPSPVLQNVSINHVTAFPPGHMFTIGADRSAPMRNITFTNSIVSAGTYPVWSTGLYGASDCAFSDIPVTTVDACFSPTTFSHNAIIDSSLANSKWPTQNYFPATAGDVGFVNYNNGSGGNYELLSSSPYIKAAADGTPLGANTSLVTNSIAGVE